MFSTDTRIDGRAWLLAGYLQDDWKVTPHFTLKLGVRYEFFSPFVDRFDKLANVDLDTDPRNLRLVLSSEEVQPSLTDADLNNFQPRIGLAHQVIPGKLVLRAGYGIFFPMPRFSPFGDSDSIVVNPPFTLEKFANSDGIVPATLLSNGFASDFLAVEKATSVLLASHERNPSLGYAQHWNLNFQYQLTRDWMFQVGYFATKGTHLAQKIDANWVEFLGPGNVDVRRRFKSIFVPTTIPGLAGPGSGVLISPIGAITRTQYTANSVFHSLQAKAERRFASGLTLLGSWIFSRSIGDAVGDNGPGQAPGSGFQNPANLRGERSLFDTHLKHRFVLSGIWDFPLGRGRRFGSNLHPVLEAFLGGWSASGIVTLTTGRPFTVTVTGDPANSGQPNRPNLVGDPAAVSRGQSVDEFFNTAAFQRNAPFTFGNLGRNTMIGPDYEKVDFSLMKRVTLFTAMDQPWDLQFRWEFFNVLNHANFGFPGSTLGTGTFGQLTSASPGRKMQVGLKLIF